MKTQEVPVPLRDFYKLFKTLEYRHNYITVFDDFLSAMMNFFTPPGHVGFDVSCFNKYTKEERLIFGSLINEIIITFDKQITDDKQWFDPFGDFYQLLASRSKQSAMGQFFTPESLVDILNMMTTGDLVGLITGAASGDQHKGKGLRISDPTCGSGRMLIAFHAQNPGNYFYGEDLDPMCCKMACINLMMHGCEGEIVNHNSLQPDDYIQGWRINCTLRRSGLPSILPMKKEESFIYTMWNSKRENTKTFLPVDNSNVNANAGKQLHMFT